MKKQMLPLNEMPTSVEDSIKILFSIKKKKCMSWFLMIQPNTHMPQSAHLLIFIYDAKPRLDSKCLSAIYKALVKLQEM